MKLCSFCFFYGIYWGDTVLQSHAVAQCTKGLMAITQNYNQIRFNPENASVEKLAEQPVYYALRMSCYLESNLHMNCKAGKKHALCRCILECLPADPPR